MRAYKLDIGTDNTEVEKYLKLGVNYIYLAGVPGDIAEFGTETGRSTYIIAKTLNDFPWESKVTLKTLHLFDSFGGLPYSESCVDQNNPSVLSGAWRAGKLKGLNPKELLNVVRRAQLSTRRVIVHIGWFCDTLPQLPAETKYAMLHIDSDLYQSAMDILGECFSRGFISEGAIIFFDDWNLNKASPEFGERRAWQELVKKYSVNYSDGGDYSWKAHKFIVHNYKDG